MVLYMYKGDICKLGRHDGAPQVSPTLTVATMHAISAVRSRLTRLSPLCSAKIHVLPSVYAFPHRDGLTEWKRHLLCNEEYVNGAKIEFIVEG